MDIQFRPHRGGFKESMHLAKVITSLSDVQQELDAVREMRGIEISVTAASREAEKLSLHYSYGDVALEFTNGNIVVFTTSEWSRLFLLDTEHSTRIVTLK